MVYKIAIIEDEDAAAIELQRMLTQYGETRQLQFSFEHHKNAITFLTNYQPVYDMIFMDIQMPHMDGMEAAAKLRALDAETILIFVTKVAQMAIKGYSVQAADFIVKPIRYDGLALTMDRVLRHLAKQKGEKFIISYQGSQWCVSFQDIYYVEIRDHLLYYHTCIGELQEYGSLNKVQRQLEEHDFCLCNNCYLVNLRHVQKIYKYTVTVQGRELTISHPRRKAFMEAFNRYIGG